MFQQDHELVPAEPGHRVFGANALVQAPRSSHQQFVAHLVAEAVVDQLEIVQVKEQQAYRGMAAFRPDQRAVQPVAEQRPIRQTSQRIEERLLRELALEILALIDAMRGDDNAADIAFVTKVGHEQFHIACPARRVDQSQLGLPHRPGLVQQLVPELPGGRFVLRLDDRGQQPVYQGIWRVAPRSLRRRALIGDLTTGCTNQNDIRGMLHHGAEPALATEGCIRLPGSCRSRICLIGP